MKTHFFKLFLFFLLSCKLCYANPALDELNHLLAQKKEKRDLKPSQRLKDLAKNYYFIFIYRSTCPHCHKFAPILKDFTDTFDLKVDAYSMDGQDLAGFSAKPLTADLFQALYVAGGYKPTIPALFLVNKDTLEAYAVLFGQAKDYELAARVNQLMQHIEEKFHD